MSKPVKPKVMSMAAVRRAIALRHSQICPEYKHRDTIHFHRNPEGMLPDYINRLQGTK